MFFGKLKNQLKIIKNNLTTEEIIQKRKELIDEFCDPEDFNLPKYVLTIDDKHYSYISYLNKLKIETIIIQNNNESLVSYKINDSLFKENNFLIKDTINIINIVVLNFLNYISICDISKCNIVFETTHESMAGIDIKLLKLCKEMFPFVNFKRRDTNE
jgi:hypothetical protein